MSAFVAITGNLTRDPEMKSIGGQQGCVFSVAARTRAKNKEDNTYKTNFYDCTMFGKQGEYFMSRAQKGSGVTILGDLSVDAYLSNGEARPALRINVTSAECQSKIKDPSDRATASSDDVAPF